jgi:hypothetical protein
MSASAGRAIYGKLTATTAVAALISTRVYPSQAVQFAAFPLVAYDVTDSEYDQTYAGPSGLSSHVITLSCVGLTHDSAEAVAEAVITAVNAATGTWGGVIVRGCFVNDVGDALETIMETEKRVWRKDVRATLWIAA